MSVRVDIISGCVMMFPEWKNTTLNKK